MFVDRFLYFIIVCGQLDIVLSKLHNWSYNGPSDNVTNWCAVFPQCCGKTQSPIDLKQPKQYNPLSEVNSFKFINYDMVLKEISVSNTGHSVQVEISDSAVIPQISGGLLNKNYSFHSAHFHWGKNRTNGSEHTFGGETFPIETHLVHYSSAYNNISEAFRANKTDSLAVLGIVYRVELFSNTALKPIVDVLSNVRFKKQSISVKTPFKLSDLLPPDTKQFFRYFGSLTTPPCNEIVAWTVFGVSSFISNKQLDKFRVLMTTKVDEKPPLEMSENYRPVQPLNQRVVYAANEL